MKVTVQNLTIDMDMVLKPTKQVWPWEVPVLQAKHGGKVQLTDVAEVERDELPDAASEYQRLTMVYGGDGGRSYAELAYGLGKAGLDALDKEIKGATGPGKAKATKKKVSKKAVPDVPEKVESKGDPLAFD